MESPPTTIISEADDDSDDELKLEKIFNIYLNKARNKCLRKI